MIAIICQNIELLNFLNLEACEAEKAKSLETYCFSPSGRWFFRQFSHKEPDWNLSYLST